MKENSSVISVRAVRFDPAGQGKSWVQLYAVPAAEPISVMALLAKIHAMDPSFACRISTCFKGQCGSCLVRLNGSDVLGCLTLVSPGESVTVEPHSNFEVIRDLVVDFTRPKESRQ